MTVHRLQVSIQYKGYTIVLQYAMYSMKPVFMYYPTSEGEQHDADCRDGETYSYTGNCKWADSIEEAKDAIMEKIMQEKPAYLVKTYSSEHKLHFNLTKFWWIEEALSFADKFNGTPLFPINSI